MKSAVEQWLSARSLALGEAVRFACWAVGRFSTPTRFVFLAALIAGLAATPWVFGEFGWWGWIWLSAFVAVALTTFALLLISYLRLLFAKRADEAKAELAAALERQSAQSREVRAMAEYQAQRLVEAEHAQERRLLEQEGRLKDQIGRQLNTNLAVLVDRMATQGATVERRLAEIVEGQEDQSSEVRRIDELVTLAEARVEEHLWRLRSEAAAADDEIRQALADVVQRAIETEAAIRRGLSDLAGRGLESEETLRNRLAEIEGRGLESVETLRIRLAEIEGRGLESEAALRSRLVELESRGLVSEETLRNRLAEIEGRGLESEAVLRSRLVELESRGTKAVGALQLRLTAVEKRGSEADQAVRQTFAELEQRRESDLLAEQAARQAAHQALDQARNDLSNLRQDVRSGYLRMQQLEQGSAELAQRLDVSQAGLSELAREVGDLRETGPKLQAAVDRLVEDLRQRMGPEFEERLRSWRERLDNEIADAVQRGRTEDQLLSQAREEALRQELKSLHDDVARHKAETQGLEAGIDARMAEAIDARIVGEVEPKLASLASKDDVEAVLMFAREAQDKIVKLGRTTASVDDLARIERGLRDVQTDQAAHLISMRRLSDANAMVAREDDRLLTPDKIARIEENWLRAFGINISRTALAYMAHKICLLEDRGEGRIAAPIESIILRQLALRSLRSDGKLEVLQAGVDFGLDAAVLYNFQGARSGGLGLTLVSTDASVDGGRAIDSVTGLEINDAVVRQNLAQLSVPLTAYRLIAATADSAGAAEQARDRLYDMVLINGDHSTEAVAEKFASFGPLVKPGGRIIFGEYGSEHWPGVRTVVDEIVRLDPNWIWIGSEFQTAILAKKQDGVTAELRVPGPKRTRKTATKASAPTPRRKATSRKP